MNEQTGQYKFRIYVDRPAILIASEVKKRKRPNEKFSPIGHTFFGLVDANGVEKRNGLYANMFAFGKENVAPEDIIRIPIDLFKKVGCSLLDDSQRRYDDVLEYNISQKQYDEAVNFVEKAKEAPPKFCVVTNNCTTFACKLAKKIGVKPPYSLIGIDIPHTYSLSIRAINKFNEIKINIVEAGRKISKFFKANNTPLKKTLFNNNRNNISITLMSKQR